MVRRIAAKQSTLRLYETPEDTRLRTWVQLMRTFLLMQKRVVAVLAEQDLTMAQFDVLATLSFTEGVTQQELAAQLLVTKGNVCGLLDRLEEIGWVQRRADPEDARANRLYLTASGRRKIEGTFPAHNEAVVSMLQGLPDSDVRALRGLLWNVEHGLEGS